MSVNTYSLPMSSIGGVRIGSYLLIAGPSGVHSIDMKTKNTASEHVDSGGTPIITESSKVVQHEGFGYVFGDGVVYKIDPGVATVSELSYTGLKTGTYYSGDLYNGKLYIFGVDDSNVGHCVVVDLETFTVENTISTGESLPTSLYEVNINNRTGILSAIQQSGYEPSREVLFVQPKTGEIVDRVVPHNLLGGAGSLISISPDHKYLLGMTYDEDELSIYDLEEDSLIVDKGSVSGIFDGAEIQYSVQVVDFCKNRPHVLITSGVFNGNYSYSLNDIDTMAALYATPRGGGSLGSNAYILPDNSAIVNGSTLISFYDGLLVGVIDGAICNGDAGSLVFKGDLNTIRYAENSNIIECKFYNYTSVPVENVIVSASAEPTGVDLTMSKTKDPFSAAQSLTFAGPYDAETGEDTFYIRVESTTSASEGPVSMNLDINADNYVE